MVTGFVSRPIRCLWPITLDSGSFLVVHALLSQDGCQREGFIKFGRTQYDAQNIQILNCTIYLCILGFPSGVKKKPHANVGDTRDVGSVRGWGTSPGGGHGNPLQCSCLKNPMNRGAWWAAVQRITKLEFQLSYFKS